MIDIEEIEHQIESNPFDASLHDKLIAKLRKSRNTEFNKLFKARLKKHEYFMFTNSEVNDTLEDLISIEKAEYRDPLLNSFYVVLVKDIPTVFYWVQYLNFSTNAKTPDELQTLYSTALTDTVNDFANSSQIWDLVLKYFEQLYKTSNEPKDLERLWALHLKRLSYPHANMESSFSQTSQFVSTYYAEEYEAFMSKADKLYSKAQQTLRHYERFEIELAKDPKSTSVWKEYIEITLKYCNGDFKRFSTVFYRSLLDADGDWKSVWLSYIYQLYRLEDEEDKNELLAETLRKFCKQYPDSCVSYAQLILNIPILEDGWQVYLNARKRIDSLGLMKSSDYNECKVLALAILSYLHAIDELERLSNDIEDFFNFAVNDNIDIFHSVEKLAISIYESRDELDKAKKLIGRLLERFSDQCEVWLYCLEFFKRNGYDYEVKSDLLKSAVENIKHIDWPERIIEERLCFELVFGDTSTYQEALVAADEAMRLICLERMVEEEEASLETATPTVTTKRPLETEEDASNKRHKVATRNREMFSIKVSNLPGSITEGAVSQFFQDCGQIKEVMIYDHNSAFEAIIEFENERSVMSSLTKSLKYIGNNQIIVKRLLNAVIWVTNFPPSYTESDIKSLFETVGKVVSVRFPTQVTGRERRFCYVEYSEPVDAQNAILDLNGFEAKDSLTDQMFELVVKLSDTTIQKKVPLFKREVYISNLNFSCGSEDVRTFFKDCGTIENVILPLNPLMKIKNNKNSGFGFVTFHSELSVQNALALNGHLLNGRPLNVHPSKKHPNTDNNNLEVFDDDTSVVLLNLPSTTNQAQLLLFLKSLKLEATRVLYVPEKSSALIKFASTPDAGKASLKLESSKFKETTIKIGSKKDLIDNKPNKPATTFVPPSLRKKRI